MKVIDCSACPGSCCRGLYLVVDNNLSEDEKIYLELHGVILVEKRKLFYPAPCIWLNNGRCQHYENRPDICRAYSCEGDKFIQKIR